MNSILEIRNPYLIFLPFLLFYLLFAGLFYSHTFIGDERRFITYAQALMHGFYSPPAPNIDLLSGPGYPILLVPIVALGIPKICIILLNAVMHYLSIVFLFKAISHFASFRKALVISLFWACYYVAYQNMIRIAYEPFTMFMLTLLFFYLVKVFDKNSEKHVKRHIILAGFIFGYIALTKVIFIPIISFMLIGCVLLWIINRKVINYKKAVFVLLIGFATFSPYMIYTYNLTGRAFYLGTGADNLYWMSTPNEGEYGDWKGPLIMNPVENGNYNIPGAGDTLVKYHQKDYDEIWSKTGVEKDDAYSRIAAENIKAHPKKNSHRIFFTIWAECFFIIHLPRQYKGQKHYLFYR